MAAIFTVIFLFMNFESHFPLFKLKFEKAEKLIIGEVTFLKIKISFIWFLLIIIVIFLMFHRKPFSPIIEMIRSINHYFLYYMFNIIVQNKNSNFPKIYIVTDSFDKKVPEQIFNLIIVSNDIWNEKNAKNVFQKKVYIKSYPLYATLEEKVPSHAIWMRDLWYLYWDN